MKVFSYESATNKKTQVPHKQSNNERNHNGHSGTDRILSFHGINGDSINLGEFAFVARLALILAVDVGKNKLSNIIFGTRISKTIHLISDRHDHMIATHHCQIGMCCYSPLTMTFITGLLVAGVIVLPIVVGAIQNCTHRGGSSRIAVLIQVGKKNDLVDLILTGIILVIVCMAVTVM